MIIYLDSSAIVKRYIEEAGTSAVNSLFSETNNIGTNLVARAEVAAGFMRAARIHLISRDDALSALEKFRSEWESYQRLSVTEATVLRADDLVTQYDLRGYDAIHLAAAVIWQEAIGEIITLATFDQKLWEAAKEYGIYAWPDEGTIIA